MFKRFRSRKTTDLDSAASDAEHSNSRREFLGPSSTIGSGSNRRTSSPSPSGLGLHVIHQPEFACLDIIFVHGLGGHSQRTWSMNHDPSLFWPKLWLPFEPDIGKARILTFGYNAAWHGATRSIASITDFAKELLFEMRFSIDEHGADLNIGANPIVFVVHSMGGLVVKKAYLLGLHDENYRNVIQSISAIMFLSTPHRGTNLAKILNRVLGASFQSPKNFVSDLNKSSPAIEELNEQFRHLAPKLSIWSFYETLATSIGPKKVMILEKESSVLGYPAEISRPLQADHHNVCKYSSPMDPNYISVRNAIKYLATQFRPRETQKAGLLTYEAMPNTQELFRNSPTTEDDYNALMRVWIPDTCKWFLDEPETISWLEPSSESRVLWFSAPPANGKSVLSAFLINHLRNSGLTCQFFLFKYSDRNKRSVAGSLQSLALQLTREMAQFKRSLDGSSAESLGLDSEDPLLIWRNVFENVLFDLEHPEPIYWVIDSLDESDSPKSLLECLESLPKAKVPIRVLIMSRNTDSISIHMDRLSDIVPVSRIEKGDGKYNHRDIELLVKRELRHMRGSTVFREQLVEPILKRSEGNFLWTRLVLDEIIGCHTEEDIRVVLEEIPDDMTRLYERIEESLIRSTRKSDNQLIRTFLEWCTCAQRPLSLTELSQALQPKYRGFLDLKRTIEDICGQFIQVEENGGVSTLHHTVRDYFMNSSKKFLINAEETHEKLFMDTLTVIGDPDLRWRLTQGEHALQSSEPFVFYSAVNWSFHLDQSNSTSSKCLDLLVKFFRSDAVLTWIHALALLQQLDVLIRASRVITSFVHNVKKRNNTENPTLHRFSDLEFLENWVIDLVKLVGRFSQTIVLKPRVLYDVIPSLCPAKSLVHQQFSSSAKIKLLGDVDTNWNDHLCRLVLPEGVQAWKVTCAGKYVAVLDSAGIVRVWDSSSFSEIASVSHGEPVTAMALNGNGTRLSTYGLKNTKIWIIPSGGLLSSTENPPDTKALTIVFAENDCKLLLGGNDNAIRHIQCDNFEGGWQILNLNLLKDTTRHEGAIVNSPMCLAFNKDKTHVAVSYRGAPLSVWRLRDGRCINRCKRVRDLRRPSLNWFAVDRVTWNPITNHVLGIYKDGRVFKWHPMTDENIEADARWAADEIAASPNGRFFATSRSDGSVRVWDFSNFSVIYQLSSENLVTELSFSPDSRRFYDLRDGSINVWEPSSLARFSESEEDSSDNSSEDQPSTTLLKFSEQRTSRFEAVTAFALAPDDTLYCVGYEDGAVTLFRKGNIDGIDLTRFHNFLPVTHINWSKDGRYVAVADLAGDIQVKMLDGHGTLPAPRIDLNRHNIEEILLNHDGERLFIVTGDQYFLCSTKEGVVQASSKCNDENGIRKWLCHPAHQDIILGYGTLDVCAYTWTGMEKLYSAPYCETHHGSTYGTVVDDMSELKQTIDSSLSSSEDYKVNRVVSNAVLSQDGSHVFFHTYKVTSKGALGNDTMIIPTANLPENVNGVYLPYYSGISRIPEEISCQIHMPLGIIHGSNLIFLDHQFWLCSYFIDTKADLGLSDTCRRFYFIPRDWIGQNSVANCVLTEDGTLFWPRDDRVVTIECNLYDTSLA
ncbi:uncharacterized protein F4807DRAFT_300678 [Annulohypoxylon truncatum]|uniref:uncharacterized protein n=1 Tax=Annulohypoxylon truncatum TaxID=327061 RepID=UPI0020072F7D|nr:uncharacterized protein F4807DRAFT_300678 [Annulohypoxylon truncatum]KAI1204936.1 hypothetical protein F4807DRAFT_300678 [Annulohypoxylon truncatum]